MKAAKIIAVLVLVYVGIVVIFESLLGYFQPAGQATLVITTTDADGMENDRVLASRESGGQLYVAVNHWPRNWYYRALDNPNVEITLEGQKAAYVAVPVSDEEHEQVKDDLAVGIGFKILTGFPPRYFVRLDAVATTTAP